MKYKDGYIADYDLLEQMTVKELEDTLIRIDRDNYLSEDAKKELTLDYLKFRKWGLDKDFAYTEENVKRMNEANELFKKQTIEVIRLAYQIFQDEMAVRQQTPDGYNHLEVKAELLIPQNVYGEEENVIGLDTERDEILWGILGSRGNNRNLHAFEVLSPEAAFNSESCDVERTILEVLHGFTMDGELDTVSWINFRDESVQRKLKDICFVRPFHNLYDYCEFSMQDILKIKRFKLNVEMLYENI